MTVKDRVGRVRHIAFRVRSDRAPRRGDVEAALRAALAGVDLRLTRYAGGVGLARVPHEAADAARAAIAGLERVGDASVRVETLGTSGTIRAAAAKFVPALKRSALPPRKGKRR